MRAAVREGRHHRPLAWRRIVYGRRRLWQGRIPSWLGYRFIGWERRLFSRRRRESRWFRSDGLGWQRLGRMPCIKRVHREWSRKRCTGNGLRATPEEPPVNGEPLASVTAAMTRPDPSPSSLPSTDLNASVSALSARIRAEYDEMPGLCLTLGQAVRLWNLDSSTCAKVLENLRHEGYLRMARARYLRTS